MNLSDLLARIASLHPSDRQWLFANASVDARMRLAEALQAAGSAPATAPVETIGVPGDAVIANLDPDDLAEVLRAEPAWITTALMHTGTWPWWQDMIRRLPITHRPIPVVGSPALSLKPELRNALLESLAERLPATVDTRGADAVSVGLFDDLLQQLRRSRAGAETRK